MSNKSRKRKIQKREVERLYKGKLTKKHLIKVLKNSYNQFGWFGQKGDLHFISIMLSGEHYSGVDDVNFEKEIIEYSYDNPNVDGDPDNGDYVIQMETSFDDAIGKINCKQNGFHCENKMINGYDGDGWEDNLCKYHEEKYKREGYI